MEYIEYYRIIKERIWLVLLGAGLAALAVIALRLSPLEKTIYTARGQVMVDGLAMQEVYSQGNELAITYPRDSGQFWATIISVGGGPEILQASLRELELPDDARERYKLDVQAMQHNNSSVVDFICSSTEKDINTKLLDVVMRKLNEFWQPYKIKEAQDVVDALTKRLPMMQKELRAAQDDVEGIEALHGGMAPDKEASIIENAMNAVQVALQSADLETSAARQRTEALADRPQRTRPTNDKMDLGIYERIDELRQQIMDRELLLTDMLTRRTPEHPSVKTLQKQIDDLKKRAAKLEALAASSSGSSTYIEEAAIAAQVYAREMATRQELLAQRETELRQRLSKARTDIIEYQKALATAEAVEKRFLLLEENIASAKAELDRRTRAKSMIDGSYSPAKLDPLQRGLRGFIMKLLMAILLGAGLGIMAAFLLHYVDTSFKNEEEAARLLGYPILGGIPHSDVEVLTETSSDQARSIPPPPET